MKAAASFTIALVLVTLLQGALLGKTTQEIARDSFASVVLIATSDRNGQPLSIGSGFVVRPGVIATNYHVIEGGVRGVAKLVGKPATFAIEGILAVDVANDLALLKSDNQLAVTLGFSDEKLLPMVGDTVFAVGNPRGLEGTFSTGIVSGLRQIGSNSLIQISAPISPGSSGGPVLDAGGKVLGVAVATYRGGQNLNFAIPVIHLRALLEMPQNLSPLSSVGSQKGKPLWSSIGDGEKSAVHATHISFELFNVNFSIQNRTPFSIGNVSGIVILRDSQGEVVHAREFQIKQPIRSGLAIRQSVMMDLESIRLSDKARTEIRILSMKTVSE